MNHKTALSNIESICNAYKCNKEERILIDQSLEVIRSLCIIPDEIEPESTQQEIAS